MIDREKVLAILAQRFPDAAAADVAATASVIAALDGHEWEEVTDREAELGYHYSATCSDICYIAQQAERGDTFRLFRRRTPLKR